jgi:hypothetical protein
MHNKVKPSSFLPTDKEIETAKEAGWDKKGRLWVKTVSEPKRG